MKCLLIETKDKRKFLTYEKNFAQLIEFSKTFNAELSIVKIDEGEILELEELAPAICDPEYKKMKTGYQVLEKKLKINARPNILKIANKVNKHILSCFQNRSEVSLKELKNKFKQYGLSDTTLCNHIRRAKKQLENQGLKFIKVSAGVYRAI